MKTEEKDPRIKILEDSPLWNGLLLDKEIRYSDFLGLFMEKYKYNLFNDIDISDSNIEINREKKHVDLWIDRKIPLIENENILGDDMDFITTPLFLVENKLKSIPYKEQLEEYTKKFVEDYFESIKKKYKLKFKDKLKESENITIAKIIKDDVLCEELKKISDLKFHLISPSKHKEFKILIPNKYKAVTGKEPFLEYIWKHNTYSELGDEIVAHISTLRVKENENSKHYLIDLFDDFGRVLQSMTIFTDVLNNSIEGDKIVDSFEPYGVFNTFRKMKSLYVKYRAAQCAELLSEKMNEPISNKSVTKLNIGDIRVHHDYTRKDSLFEVKKKLKDDLMIIIQYQNRELRKGLVIRENTVDNYETWFTSNWDNLSFNLKDKDADTINKKFNKYKINSDLTLYYSKCPCDNLKVSQILRIMINHINDEDMLEFYTEKGH